MSFLLDTHALLWFQEGSRKLGSKARALIEDPTREIWLSAASVWEIAIKQARGRLRTRRQISEWLPEKMRENSLLPLAVTFQHAIAAVELPRHHEDPFDRMLAAQSIQERLRLISRDPVFEEFGVETFW